MKLKELIEKLKVLEKENGNLECWYAIDEEGNDYRPVVFAPVIGWISEDEPKVVVIN